MHACGSFPVVPVARRRWVFDKSSKFRSSYNACWWLFSCGPCQLLWRDGGLNFGTSVRRCGSAPLHSSSFSDDNISSPTASYVSVLDSFRFLLSLCVFCLWTSAFPYCAVFHVQSASSSSCALRFVGCSKHLHIAKDTGWLPFAFVCVLSSCFFRNVSSDSLEFLRYVLLSRFSSWECPHLVFLFRLRYHWSLSRRTCTRLSRMS
jgi:hypothetical protein